PPPPPRRPPIPRATRPPHPVGPLRIPHGRPALARVRLSGVARRSTDPGRPPRAAPHPRYPRRRAYVPLPLTRDLGVVVGTEPSATGIRATTTPRSRRKPSG